MTAGAEPDTSHVLGVLIGVLNVLTVHAGLDTIHAFGYSDVLTASCRAAVIIITITVTITVTIINIALLLVLLWFLELSLLCRAGQHHSHAPGGNLEAAGAGGQGHSDHHPPALLQAVPDAGQASTSV